MSQGKTNMQDQLQNSAEKQAEGDLRNHIYPYRVAVVEWKKGRDGIAEVIHDELNTLGHRPFYFKHDAAIPKNAEIIFSFAPYGNFLQIPLKLACIPVQERPILFHLNTEGLPDLRIPWFLMRYLGAFRSWIGRLGDSDHSANLSFTQRFANPWKNRILRFRYLGDYYYTYRNGLLDVFADTSAIYARLHTKHGLPTLYAPWGATPLWYEDLNQERDIDVLWMGKRASRRRSALLDRIRQELAESGIQMHVVDNIENPFIHGKERTEILNRAKITLNLTRTWYDDNFSRFAMAAPNRSLVVSEPLLPHCPQFVAGLHYVSAPVDRLAETIRFYLEHSQEREAIVENAYELVTTELTFQNSINSIMKAIHLKASA